MIEINPDIYWVGINDRTTDLYYESEMLRYFSNIVGMYSTTVQAGLRKLENWQINMVAPTHGPVWRSYKRDQVYSR